MIDPDYRLCPVRAISCTHHAHCARSQLKPHATRQAWLTPNRRGDECQYFTPIEAYTLAEPENLGRSANSQAGAAARETAGESGSANALTPAGSDAANTEPRTNAEAGGVSFPEREARAIGVTVGDVVHEPAGVHSASAGLGTEQQDRAIRLNALRIIFGKQS